MAAEAEETPRQQEEWDEEDDEHGSKEKVLQKYFLQEWELVKSLSNDIVSHGRVSDPSIPHKIRSIVLFLFLSLAIDYSYLVPSAKICI